MVTISITLDDLDLIIKSLDSADIYVDATPEEERKFYDHLNKLRVRLERTLKKYDAIAKIDDKIKWNHTLLKLGRGFETIEQWEKATHELYDERNRIMKGGIK